METNLVSYHPKNPFRVTNWRWELARTLRESGRYKLRTAAGVDEWTEACLKLQLALVKNPDPLDQFAIADKWPELYYAYAVFRRQSGAENKHPLRYMIEARILADQPDEDIAKNAGVDPQLIGWYEKAFFNVREKLDNSDYIMSCVIGPAVYTGLNEREYDLLWKVFGYLYGNKVLEAFIRTTNKSIRPKRDEEVAAVIMTDTKSALQRKAAVAARTFTLNSFTQSDLLMIYSKFLELEKEGDASSAKDFFMQNVQVILNSLPWVPGSDSDSPLVGKVDHPALIPYDKTNAELRTEELLALAAGKQIQFEDIQFPEPAANDAQGSEPR